MLIERISSDRDPVNGSIRPPHLEKHAARAVKDMQHRHDPGADRRFAKMTR
jgi:hypothetical protein